MGRPLRARTAADPAPAAPRDGGRQQLTARAGPVPAPLLECVVNVSEGRDPTWLDRLARTCGPALLDFHADPSHHRAVLTLAGTPDEVDDAVRRLARQAVHELDLRAHQGVHPRLGVLDVVPFVSLRPDGPAGGELRLGPGDISEAVAARDRFAAWAGSELEVPCFLYGPRPDGGRTLPEVRRQAFGPLLPDTGPSSPHPSAGACAVGARDVLVAYNVWLEGTDLPTAKEIARVVRGPGVRTLGLEVEDGHQVSCNLVDPWQVGPQTVVDRVRAELAGRRGRVGHTELVGLVPAGVLRAIPESCWEELDLSWERTIEARLERRLSRR